MLFKEVTIVVNLRDIKCYEYSKYPWHILLRHFRPHSPWFRRKLGPFERIPLKNTGIGWNCNAALVLKNSI